MKNLEDKAMRTVLVLTMILALGGCGVELLTTTAIQGELQAQNMKAVQGQAKAIAESAAKTRLQQAINMYMGEKGGYPASLNDLVPNYIDAIPKRVDGQYWGYDPQTGRLLETSVPEPSGIMSGAFPVGGGGPLGAAVTGMGMQQQMNSMSNGGTNAAGGYARGEISGAVGGHNQQQEQVMDNLGL